jgi:glucan phosphoethanolaminetransferase (alkaline phosphatase superfamily)
MKLPRVVGLLAAGLLAACIVAFACSHQFWFDAMRVEDKTSFFSNFFVAYGTSALALITWASVYETQRVVIGEDRRFQQSLAPS